MRDFSANLRELLARDTDHEARATNHLLSTAPAIVDFSTNGNQQDAWGYPNSSVDGGGPLVYVYPDNPSYPNLERYRLYPISGYTSALNGSNS